MDRLIALVLLRFRLELRAFTRAKERLLGLLLLLPGLATFAVVVSVLAYFGVRSVERAQPEALLPLLSALATALGVLWALSPLVAGVALSEAHDVTRLLHFPIPLPTLVASSLVANLAQPTVLSELPLLLALSLALAGASAGLPFAFAGLLLSFGFVLAAAQAVGLLLIGLARNRRLHDLALSLGLALGFALSLLPMLFFIGGPRPLLGALRLLTATDAFVLSPYAWGARAAVHAGRGEVLPALAFGLLGALAIAGAMGASALLIHRIHRGELSLAPWSGAGLRPAARMRFEGSVGTLLEKDVRSAWRDPALRTVLLMGLIGPLVFLFILSQTRMGMRSPAAILVLASLVGIGTYGANALGVERRGIGLLVSFPVERWRLLLAKNLAAMAFRLPGLLTLLVAGSLLAPVAVLPAALTVAAVTLLLAAGVDNYMSVLFPVSAPAAGQNPYGGAMAGSRGLAAALLGTLLLFGALALSGPFVFLAWLPLLLQLPWLWAISLPLALAGAISAYAMLVAGAARLFARREPEILERILGEL